MTTTSYSDSTSSWMARLHDWQQYCRKCHRKSQAWTLHLAATYSSWAGKYSRKRHWSVSVNTKSHNCSATSSTSHSPIDNTPKPTPLKPTNSPKLSNNWKLPTNPSNNNSTNSSTKKNNSSPNSPTRKWATPQSIWGMKPSWETWKAKITKSPPINANCNNCKTNCTSTLRR